MAPSIIYVMGTSGCGKTTISTALASKLGYNYGEGDHMHSNANKEKMASGRPLTDEDRRPWLSEIHEYALKHPNSVLTCSALKRTYREALRKDLDAAFIFLKVDKNVLLNRLKNRVGHFMPATLLDSQLDTLEDPTGEPNTFVIENHGDKSVETVVDNIVWLLNSKMDPNS
ncbi:unnamed protein product, partial [Mesorhabditis spiculigera]